MKLTSPHVIIYSELFCGAGFSTIKLVTYANLFHKRNKETFLHQPKMKGAVKPKLQSGFCFA